jgi:hypothetical protein
MSKNIMNTIPKTTNYQIVGCNIKNDEYHKLAEACGMFVYKNHLISFSTSGLNSGGLLSKVLIGRYDNENYLDTFHEVNTVEQAIDWINTQSSVSIFIPVNKFDKTIDFEFISHFLTEKPDNNHETLSLMREWEYKEFIVSFACDLNNYPLKSIYLPFDLITGEVDYESMTKIITEIPTDKESHLKLIDGHEYKEFHVYAKEN